MVEGSAWIVATLNLDGGGSSPTQQAKREGASEQRSREPRLSSCAQGTLCPVPPESCKHVGGSWAQSRANQFLLSCESQTRNPTTWEGDTKSGQERPGPLGAELWDRRSSDGPAGTKARKE